MGFTVFIVISWVAVFAFFTMKRSLSVVENTFIYLVVLIVEINFSWIVSEELKDIWVTNNGLKYTAYLVFRSVLMPTLYVILFNFIYQTKSMSLALFAAAASVAVMLALNGLARFYDIERYTNWSLMYDAIYFILLEAAVFGLHRVLRRIRHAEARRS